MKPTPLFTQTKSCSIAIWNQYRHLFSTFFALAVSSANDLFPPCCLRSFFAKLAHNHWREILPIPHGTCPSTVSTDKEHSSEMDTEEYMRMRVDQEMMLKCIGQLRRSHSHSKHLHATQVHRVSWTVYLRTLFVSRLQKTQYLGRL